MSEVILHLGAHRTASTTIQSALRNELSASKQDDISVATPSTHRDTLFGPLGRISRNPLTISTENIVNLQQNLETLFGTNKRVIISEENLLGQLTAPFEKNEFYPNPTQMIAILLELYPLGAPPKIILTIRNRADYYSSIYAYRLGTTFFEKFDYYREALLTLARSWHDVVNDICNFMPNSEIIVFDFDFLKNNWDVIFAEFGLKSIKIPKVSNGSFSNEIIADVLKITSPDEPLSVARRSKLRKISQDNQHTRFQPWGEEELAHFKAEYLRDLANIRAHTPARLMTSTIGIA